jgi:hypothetical protein
MQLCQLVPIREGFSFGRRTHWISGELSRKEREHLEERASRAPELVVIQPLNDTWKCH